MPSGPPLVGSVPASTAQPPKQVPSYVIGPNDVLRVNVFPSGQLQPNFRLSDFTVQPDGAVILPRVGPIRVAGQTVAAANSAIRRALLDSGTYTEVTVDIVMIGYHSSTLKVQGAVRNPGNITMTAERMNIQDALAAAGGINPSGGSSIRVRRVSSTEWAIYSRADLNAGKLADVMLHDGDTIDVLVAPKFFVQGFVATPGEVQWEENLTLERALVRVGGVTADGAKNRVKVRRMDPATKEYKEIKLNKDAMSTPILADDVIVVPKRRL
jgi:protein involved in polysaccharide export with SLBB domain